MVADETAWADREFTGHDFREEDLSRLRTERVVFTECDFSGVDMSESQHFGSAFRNCTFRRATLWHSTFTNCSLLGSVFAECRLRPIKIVESDLTLAVFGGCDLRSVDLSDCRMREASLVGVDLRKAVLRQADLTGARVQDAKLDEADLRGSRRPHLLDHREAAWREDRYRPGAGLLGRARPGRPRRLVSPRFWRATTGASRPFCRARAVAPALSRPRICHARVALGAERHARVTPRHAPTPLCHARVAPGAERHSSVTMGNQRVSTSGGDSGGSQRAGD